MSRCIMSSGIRTGAFAGASTSRRLVSARRAIVLRSASTDTSAPSTSAPAAASEPVRLTLKKPVGLVFEQAQPGGPVFVAEVVEGGNAEMTGAVQEGDILSRCSAVLLKEGKEGEYEKEGYGKRPYDNWEVVDFDCEGKEFKTVMMALKSNNERWGRSEVMMQFRKP